MEEIGGGFAGSCTCGFSFEASQPIVVLLRFELDWIGWNRIVVVGHFAERMYVLLLGGDWSEEKLVNESDPVVTQRNVQTNSAVYRVLFQRDYPVGLAFTSITTITIHAQPPNYDWEVRGRQKRRNGYV